jgi:hypothetical protein
MTYIVGCLLYTPIVRLFPWLRITCEELRLRFFDLAKPLSCSPNFCEIALMAGAKIPDLAGHCVVLRAHNLS